MATTHAGTVNDSVSHTLGIAINVLILITVQKQSVSNKKIIHFFCILTLL